jgi:hypothetical protein
MNAFRVIGGVLSLHQGEAIDATMNVTIANPISQNSQ